MIDQIRKAQKDDSGFTLIELLVVVIIIGILAAIAIPVFLNQRESAWESAVQSDLRNAAVEAESHYTQNGEYDADTMLDGFTSTDGVNVVVETPATGATGQEFCLDGDHDNIGAAGAVLYSYHSADGGIGGYEVDCASR